VGSVTAGCVMMVMMMMSRDSLLSVSSEVAAAAEMMMMMMMMSCDSLLPVNSGVAGAAPAVTHCCRRRTYHRCCKQLLDRAASSDPAPMTMVVSDDASV